MTVMTPTRPDLDQRVENLLPQDSSSDEDWYAEASASPAPVVIPPTSRPVEIESAVALVEVVEAPRSRSRVLDGLLRMADTYRVNGAMHQALELYFSLIGEHEGSPQAEEAVDRVLDIAARYEQAGELRQARSIYEQLL